MSGPLNYDNVGLGLSFQQPGIKYIDSPVVASQGSFHDDQYGHERFNSQQRPKNVQYETGNHHYRSQSAIIPQRPTFDRVPKPSQTPRSAMPVQQPFIHVGLPSSYTHSAPTTPSHEPRQSYNFHQGSQTEYRDAPRSTVFDRRQQQRARIDSRPPPPKPKYYSSPHFVEPSAKYTQGHDSRSVATNSPASSGSYFYMTPQVHSTPFSDAGQFAVPENYGNQSTAFNTPHLLASPVFEDYQEHAGYNNRNINGSNNSYYMNSHNDMPEDPYVRTEVTNFPPSRPSALTSTQSFEQDPSMADSDMNDGDSRLNSPMSSPNGTPYFKDRKVAYSRWTSQEDLLLKEAIAVHGDSKWSLVSQMVPGRTPMQCSTRWQGALNTSIHKGRWDPEEDAILIKAVSEWQTWHITESQNEQGKRTEEVYEEMYKNIPWSNIVQLLPRPRTGVQALARWSEALDPRITKGKWTDTEDTALLRGVGKYGKCWIKIAAGVKGRTQRQCRTRYCQISDKKRKVKGGPVRRLTGSPELDMVSD